MKKFLFLALILCMTSCIVNNEDPCTCTPGNTSKTITVRVKATDWQYSNQGINNYFYAGVDVPEITENVFNKGEVKPISLRIAMIAITLASMPFLM